MAIVRIRLIDQSLFRLSFPLYLVHYSTNLPNEVVESLKGEAKYVTLGRTKEWYFVKLGEGQWIGDLQEGAMKGYNEIRTGVGANFDAALTGMVFGKVGPVSVLYLQTL